MEKPVLKIRLSAFDWLLELLSLVILLFGIYCACKFYVSHKDIVYPVKAKSKAQRSDLVVVFSFLSVLLYIGLTLISQVPHTFNYLVEITENNAEIEYKGGLKILRVAKLVMVITMLLASGMFF